MDEIQLSEVWRRFIEDLPYSVIGAFPIFGIFGYLTTSLVLFLPGWALTCRIKNAQAHIWVRAGLIAITWAPGLTMEPGGMVLLVPASLGVVWGAMVYLVPGHSLGIFFYQPLASMFLVWCVAVVVSEVSLRKKRKEQTISAECD